MLYHAGPIATHQPHQATLFTSQCYTYNTTHINQHNTIHTATCRYTLLSYEQPLNVSSQCISLVSEKVISYIDTLEVDGQTSGFIRQADCIDF